MSSPTSTPETPASRQDRVISTREIKFTKTMRRSPPAVPAIKSRLGRESGGREDKAEQKSGQPSGPPEPDQLVLWARPLTGGVDLELDIVHHSLNKSLNTSKLDERADYQAGMRRWRMEGRS